MHVYMWANNRILVDIKAHEKRKQFSFRLLLINGVSALIGGRIRQR